MPGNLCYVPENGGEVLVEAVANPAAGADWLFTVPDGFEYLFSVVWYQLVTASAPHTHDATFVFLQMPGALVLHQNDLHAVIQDETHRFNLYLGASRTADVAGPNDIVSGALPNVRLPSGFQIGSQTETLDVGDQYSDIRLTVVRWKV